MKRLNIIGAGKLGQTLGHLFHQQQLFIIGDIVNRTQSSAESACKFIGAGRPLAQLEKAGAADIWLIATPDSDIENTAQALRSTNLLKQDSVVFHCSGSLSSNILKTGDDDLGSIASIHPVHSFALPANSVENFSGTYCAYEGEDSALQFLLPVFQTLGAELFVVDSEQKSVYHAASVMACNYLVALMDASLSCFEQAGVPADTARKLLLPITHATLDNTLLGSPESALTGPIARGDVNTVATQLEQLSSQPHLAQLYRQLGQQTLRVATRRESNEGHQHLEKLLRENDNPV